MNLGETSALGAQAQPTSPQSVPSKPVSSIRLRIYWGGGKPQPWAGSIRLTKGEFSNCQVLGITSDAAASAIAIGDQVRINHWSATNFGGIDIDVPDVEGNQLLLSFGNQSSVEQSQFETAVPLSDLLQGTISKDLDANGSRVMISRSPGDVLPVRIERPHLIFKPEETFEFWVRVNRSEWISQKANCRIRILPSEPESSSVPLLGSGKTSGSFNMLHPGNRQLHSPSLPIETDGIGSAPEQLARVTVPKDPGVYNITLELNSPWQQASLKPRPTIAREIQIVVLESSPASLNSVGDSWKKIAAIDSTSDSSSLLPKSFKPANARALANEQQRMIKVDGRTMLELEVGGWKAIPLSFQQLDQPHLIEVEYLADQPASIGFSLLESNANGQIPLYGIDSGLHIPSSLIDVYPKAESAIHPNLKNSAGNSQQLALRRHQFVVWPKDKHSFLLIANRDNHHNATIGAIDIFAGPSRLPSHEISRATPTATADRRQFMVLSEEGLFAKNLGGPERIDASGNVYDDWSTFYKGADRLVQHLKSQGYSGAMITIAAEGSSLYPTNFLGNSPRLDSGLLSNVGQDPIRKDVVELLFRMFEREGLTLVPAVIFNGPLPSIESAILLSSESGPSIRPVNWSKSNPKATNHHFPIYNPLHPAVQSEVNSAVGEIATRYGGFQCFGGVAIICRPNSYTILPGQQWCWDTETLRQFWSDIQGDPNLLGNRESLVEKIFGAHQDDWLQWRAQRMTQWYQTLSKTLQQHHAGAVLFLAPVDMYLNDELATVLAPSLHSTPDYAKQMLRLGWDAARLAQLDEVRLLKPQRLAPNQSLASNRLDVSLENQLQSDDFFRNANSIGDLYVHRISWAHFSQLESKAPFDSQRTSLMRLQPLTPAGLWNRQRFLNSLRASDAQFLIDGGALLSLGQEEELREFRALFRQLPAQPFADVDPLDPIKPSQKYAPIIVRQHLSSEGLWFYVVNPSPWPCKVRLKLSGTPSQPLSIRQLNGAKMKEITGEGIIELELDAINMTAGVMEQVSAIESYQFQLPPNAADRLRKQVHALQTKLLQSTESKPLDVLSNSYFEINGQPSLSGWELGQRGTRAISLVTNEPLKGMACLRLNNDDASPTWIRSNAFQMPLTGRLSVSVWLRTPNPSQQPPLRISVEGVDSDSNYYRFGSIGSLSADPQNNQLNDQWQRFAVHFDDLPVSRLSQIRIGLDLMGAGTVEADQFEVFDRWFDENDAKAINQRLASSGLLLANPLTYESSRILLGSYWLRFLDEHFREQPTGQLAAGSGRSGTKLKASQPEAESQSERESAESESAEDSTGDPNERGLFRRLRRNNRIQR